MFTSTAFSPTFLRAALAVTALLQKFLMVFGLVFLIGLFGIQTGHSGLIDGLKTLISSSEVADDEISAPEEPAEQSTPALSPKMRGALDYVSKRYRVSNEALEPIFAAAQSAGKELRLDPLLIIAVIGVESAFNPYSQSVVGAKGLMQVVPRYHLDKLPDDVDASGFLDPLTNVRVGAKVLHESISRSGGVENGLQQFGGAVNDPDRRYSTKVLAEKQRLEQATQRLRTN
ncbi:MAG: transglycosylase SLT domain-containing protein [Dechloromonas sp.]|nr:transglycosylase SLT domain-containing protein [Dechloromonas sp.]